MIKLFVIFSLNIIIGIQTYGQADTFLVMSPVEITTKRLENYAIGQNQIISDQEKVQIQKTNGLSRFLLAETPITLKSYGTGLSSISFRGLASNHLAVLWNGINLQNPLNGILDFGILDMYHLQDVHLQMGGNSSLFGSGAIGGTLHLNNKKPQDMGFKSELGLGIGSYGLRQIHSLVQYRKKWFSADLTFSNQSAENHFTYKNSAQIGMPIQKASHAAFDRKNLQASFHFDISKKDILKIFYWRSANQRQIEPTMTSANTFATLGDTSSRLLLDFTHLFKNSYIKAKVAYLRDFNHFNSTIVQNSQNGVESFVQELDWIANLNKNHQLRIGSNLTIDQSINNNYRTNETRTRFGFFINEAFQSRFIKIAANLRHEWIDSQGSPLSMYVGMEKNIISKESSNLSVKASVSRNFNLPTFNDLFWPDGGNRTLKPELGWSKEIGLHWGINNSIFPMKLFATVFDINITDRIIWTPSNDGRWRPNNLDQFFSTGLELGVSGKFQLKKSNINVSFSYQNANNRDQNRQVLLFTPRHILNSSIMWNINSFNILWTQNFSDKRFASSDRSTWSKSYSVSNLLISKSIKIAKNTLVCRADISNLFNADYQVVLFHPMPRRQLKIEVLYQI